MTETKEKTLDESEDVSDEERDEVEVLGDVVK